MIEPYSCSEITILAYFSRTSIVNDVIATFTNDGNKNNPNCRLKDLYEKLFKVIQDKYRNGFLKYNKSAILFEYKGREFFIGCTYNNYVLGLSCYVVHGYIMNFKGSEIKCKDYISHTTFNDYNDVVKMFEE